MKATELRIGNWYDHNGKPEKATPNTILHLWESEREWIKPIPITEEVLLKCGFTKGDNQTMNDHFFFIETERIMVSVNPENGVLFIEQSEHQVKLTQKITCIHQLQNLYYALTGQELTYTP